MNGSSSSPGPAVLLPTPRTTDTNGPGDHGTGGPDLRTVVALLPTPRARDGKRGGKDCLEPALLPTPRASDTGTPGRRASKGFRPPLSQVLLSGGDATAPPSPDGNERADGQLLIPLNPPPAADADSAPSSSSG